MTVSISLLKATRNLAAFFRAYTATRSHPSRYERKHWDHRYDATMQTYRALFGDQATNRMYRIASEFRDNY